jgi:ABC-type lipoprotein export system ATPase subunit
VHAQRGVNVVIEDGDWLAIQGPTGHGKSTLLQILGALDRPTSGTVELDGQDLTGLRESQLTKVRATSIGFIFQTFNLIPTLSAQENVEAALVPLHPDAGHRKERARQALAEVGLDERAGHLPSELSGGQQHRVAIVRALVKKPGVLLADEPTGNLRPAQPSPPEDNERGAAGGVAGPVPAPVAWMAAAISARSSSFSSRVAAGSQPLTCCGVRPPTMAPVTAGKDRVQATAMAAGLTPWRSATGSSAWARARLAVRAGSVKSGWPRRQSPGSRVAARAAVKAPVSRPEAIGL